MSPRTPPDTAHLQHLNTLLEQALELPDSERDAWLQALPDEHCALVPVLRALLIRTEVETDTFMRKPVGLTAGFDAAGARSPGRRRP